MSSSEATAKPHFTYVDPTGPDLHQGDILRKDQGIRELLAKIHPHYTTEDYSHLMVVTQTCDMARREGQLCKSRYITMVAVRSLDTVMIRELAKYQYGELESKGNLCSDKSRVKMELFLERLFNNNNEEYFYLHPDAKFEFLYPACAFLRLPISIRSGEHYQTCLDARIMSLEENFRAKLGHHVGSIYSRVGTADFVPTKMSSQEFKGYIADVLDRLCKWVPEEKVASIKKEIKNEEIVIPLDEGGIRKLVDDHKLKSRKDQVIEKSVEIIKQIITDLPEQKTNQIKNLLKSDPLISKIVK